MSRLLNFVLLFFLSCNFLIASDPIIDSWILLADPHVGVSIDDKKEQLLRDFCDSVLALPERPIGLIGLGDNTAYEGLPGDYEQYCRQLAPLTDAGLRIDNVLGDHDRREGFFAAIPWAVRPELNENLLCRDLWKDAPEKDYRYVNVIETPYANWFLLDSCDPQLGENGRLGTLQLQWLAMELEARPDKPAILVAHHQLNTFPIACIVDSNALKNVMRDHQHVKAFIYGHTHLWMKTELNGVHIVNIPALKTDANVLGVQLTIPAYCALVTLREDGLTIKLITVQTVQEDEATEKVYDFPWLR